MNQISPQPIPSELLQQSSLVAPALSELQSQLLDHSALFRCSKGEKFAFEDKDKRVVLSSIQQIQSFISEDYNVSLDLKKCKLVAFDIDIPIIATALILLLKQLEINCFATSSPRGGCHIYFSSSEETNSYRQGNVVVPLGFQCEFFKSKPLVMFGQLYKNLIEPKCLPLSNVPNFLLPLTTHCSEKWVKAAAFFDELILEGQRNNVLFKIAKTMQAHPTNYKDPRNVLSLIAHYFCNPSYDEPLDHMFDETHGDSESKKRHSISAVTVFGHIGIYSLIFDDSEEQWFKSDPDDQLWKMVDEYDLRIFLWETLESMGEPRMSLAALKTLIEELRGYCKLRDDVFPEENGIAFLNGWLNLDTMEFLTHTQKRFVHSFLKIDYNADAQLTESVKNLLTFWVRGDKHYLNHLRGFFARILLRPLWFRAALLISGPPRTGKSTFVNLLQAICHDSFVILNEACRSFDKALWKEARAIVLNDCSFLDRKMRDIIRQLSGSDLMTYEKKYVQISSKQAFRFRGVVVVVSNHSKDELISNTGDTALAQRFIEIEFTNNPSEEQINPQILVHLQDSIPAIINWALHVDSSVMSVQAGAINLDRSVSIFAIFMIKFLAKDPDGLLSLGDLKDYFSEHLNTMGIQRNEVKTSLKRGIINESSATFNYIIKDARTTEKRGLKGIRIRKADEPPSFALSTESRFDSIDPWNMNQRFNLTDFEAKYSHLLKEDKLNESDQKKPQDFEPTLEAKAKTKKKRPTPYPVSFDNVSKKETKIIQDIEVVPSTDLFEMDQINSEIVCDFSGTKVLDQLVVFSEHNRQKDAELLLTSADKLVNVNNPTEAELGEYWQPWNISDVGRMLEIKSIHLINTVIENIQNPFSSGAIYVLEVPDLFEKALDRFSHFPPLPKVRPDYNPFFPYMDAPVLIDYKQKVLDMPSYWIDLLDLFEDILPPHSRSWIYYEIHRFMPNKRGLGTGWYSNQRDSGVCSTLFAQRYKGDAFYGRIFPDKREDSLNRIERILETVPFENPLEAFRRKLNPKLKIAKPKVNKDSKHSTVTGLHRQMKMFYLVLLNKLMEHCGVQAQFVEIDIVSCHARVLCHLFPEKTPLLTAVFNEDKNLWKEIIIFVPENINSLISKQIETKKIVKIVAYKVLQSGLNSKDQIKIAIEDSLAFLKEDELLYVVEGLRTNPVILEMKSLYHEVNRRAEENNLSVYTHFQIEKLEFKPEKGVEWSRAKSSIYREGKRTYCNNPFRLCSTILVGLEFLILCAIVNVLSELKTGIPINLEHDGCLCLIDLKNGAFNIDQFNERFSQVLFEKTGIKNMKIEMKKIDFN